MGSEPPKSGTLAALRQKAMGEGDERLLDLRGNIAWLAAAKESLIQRLEENDTPMLRKQALSLLKQEEFGDLAKLLEEGIHSDELAKKITDLAEREAVLQARATELLMRAESTITTRQAYIFFQDVIKIIATLCERHQANKIVAEIYRQILGTQPKIALAAGGDPPEMAQANSTVIEVEAGNA